MSYTRVQSHENVLFGLYMMSSIFHPQHSPALLIAVMFDDKKKTNRHTNKSLVTGRIHRVERNCNGSAFNIPCVKSRGVGKCVL